MNQKENPTTGKSLSSAIGTLLAIAFYLVLIILAIWIITALGPLWIIAIVLILIFLRIA